MGTTLNLQGQVERTRLSDTVYEKLLDAIISGKMVSGAIVSEVSLAKQMQVSRTPVHDALRQLAKDGLVEQRAGRRAIITAFRKEDLFDIFEMRKLLECHAARLAAARIDAISLVRLRKLTEEIQEHQNAADFVTRWADFDETFHDIVAQASGSPRLWHDVARYRLLHRSFNKLTTNLDVLQHAISEHLHILEALENRDPEAAAAAMNAHITEWQTYFVNQVPR